MKHDGCNKVAKNISYLIDNFYKQGLFLTKMAEPYNSLENFLQFEFNLEKRNEYKLKREQLDIYINELDKFNLPNISSDSIVCEKIALNIKPRIPKLLEIYSSLDSYLVTLAMPYLFYENKLKGLNILKANLIMFPQSEETLEGLGIAYFLLKNYSLSLCYFNKSLELNPNNKDVLEAIEEVNKEMQKKE
jgi:tetratricopeptide (TPR) repeat protein